MEPKNYLWNTGCIATAPGERGTTLKTGRKEEGESFTADYFLIAVICEWLVAAVMVVVVVASLWLGTYRVSQP